MADRSLTWRLFGEDVTAGRTIKNVGDEADKTAKKIKDAADKFTPLLMAVTTLGPALIPILATATAGAAGMGVAFVSGAAALGVFGAVAKASFKDVTDGTKLAAKGTLDLTSPVGKATLAYQGMLGAWEKFVAANQPVVFRQMGAGFNIISTALPKLQPLFNVAARSVASFEAQLQHFVSGGGLDHLVHFLAANAGPALESFRRTMTNLAVGVGYLGPLFARFAAGFEVGMVRMSASFASWAANAGRGGGFQKFLDYVVANTPTVISTLHSLAESIVRIVQGLAPLGPLSLSFVGVLARIVSALPPQAVTAIAVAFVSLSTAMKAAAIASSLFERSIGATPIGAAALALGGLISLFLHHSQAVAKARDEVATYQATLDKATAAITANTRETAANSLEQAGAFKAAQSLGISLSDVTSAALGNKDAIDAVNAALAPFLAQQEFRSVGRGNILLNQQRSAADQLAKAIGTVSGRIQGSVDAQKRQIAATDPATGSLNAEAVAAANTARQMSTLATALLKVAGVNLGVAQTDIQFRDSVAALSQSVQSNGRSLDINTAKGRANRSAVLSSIQAALSYADAVAKQTGSTVRGQQAFQNSIPAIVRQAAAVGFNKAQVDALIHSIGGVKSPPPIRITTVGIPATVSNLAAVRAYLDSIQSKTIAVTTVYNQIGFKAGVNQPTGFSRGGPVVGGIPGRDSVPALLMPGEEVLTIPQARAYRASHGGGGGTAIVINGGTFIGSTAAGLVQAINQAARQGGPKIAAAAVAL